jgi:hypothetical protein
MTLASLQVRTVFPGGYVLKPWLVVDGKAIARLPRRGTYALPLLPGEHVAYVEGLYLRTKDVHFEITRDDEEVNLECGPLPLVLGKFAWARWLPAPLLALWLFKSITNDHSFPTAHDCVGPMLIMTIILLIWQRRIIKDNPETAYLRLTG